jgi:GT2 family glycosyltransferase
LIRFDHSDRPLVSIVMPTQGSWHWVRQSLAAVTEHTADSFEVIVCDNGSSDGTAERLLDSVSGARLVLNERNLGFAAACNQGAALSRAPYLVFLNSDAIVHSGWLSPLLERAEDERVAAVAPLLLNLDGSVQEAGALIFREAETVLYGFGGDAHDSNWAFSRVVDYASAACLLVRRSAFNLVGGFDTSFGLAYYEDLDLCLALSERRLFTVYEPRSLVTHARGGSCTEEDVSALRRINQLNQLLARSRWRRRLALRPPLNMTNPHGVGVRDAPAASRVLMLTGTAGAETARELTLARPDVRVTFLVRDDEPSAPAALRRDGVEVHTVRHVAAWLAKRRFHYDLVVGGEDIEALARTQPQALFLASTSTTDALVDGLALAPLPVQSHEPPTLASGRYLNREGPRAGGPSEQIR